MQVRKSTRLRDQNIKRLRELSLYIYEFDRKGLEDLLRSLEEKMESEKGNTRLHNYVNSRLRSYINSRLREYVRLLGIRQVWLWSVDV